MSSSSSSSRKSSWHDRMLKNDTHRRRLWKRKIIVDLNGCCERMSAQIGERERQQRQLRRQFNEDVATPAGERTTTTTTTKPSLLEAANALYGVVGGGAAATAAAGGDDAVFEDFVFDEDDAFSSGSGSCRAKSTPPQSSIDLHNPEVMSISAQGAISVPRRNAAKFALQTLRMRMSVGIPSAEHWSFSAGYGASISKSSALAYIEITRSGMEVEGAGGRSKSNSSRSERRAHFVADCAAGYNSMVLPRDSDKSSVVASAARRPITAQLVGPAKPLATTSLCGAVPGTWTHFPFVEIPLAEVCDAIRSAEPESSEVLPDLDTLISFRCFLRSGGKGSARGGSGRKAVTVRGSQPGDVLIGQSTISLRWLLSAQPVVLAPHALDAQEASGFVNPLDVNPLDIKPFEIFGSAMALLSSAVNGDTDGSGGTSFVPRGRAALPLTANLCSVYITRVELVENPMLLGCSERAKDAIDGFIHESKQNKLALRQAMSSADVDTSAGRRAWEQSAFFAELRAIFERKLELEEAIGSLSLERADCVRALDMAKPKIARLEAFSAALTARLEAKVRASSL
jgi:hypothetical protein